MAVLFPMCLYEAKMSMLVNTYLKTLRKEKVLLVLNICSVLLSLFLTFLTINILNSLTLSVFLIVVLLAVRCVVAEIYLARILNVNLYSDNIIETMMAALFIVTSWYIQNWTGTFIYGVGCVAYVYIKRNDLLRIKNVVFVNS
jgi:hypothetical protein